MSDIKRPKEAMTMAQVTLSQFEKVIYESETISMSEMWTSGITKYFNLMTGELVAIKEDCWDLRYHWRDLPNWTGSSCWLDDSPDTRYWVTAGRGNNDGRGM